MRPTCSSGDDPRGCTRPRAASPREAAATFLAPFPSVDAALASARPCAPCVRARIGCMHAGPDPGPSHEKLRAFHQEDRPLHHAGAALIERVRALHGRRPRAQPIRSTLQGSTPTHRSFLLRRRTPDMRASMLGVHASIFFVHRCTRTMHASRANLGIVDAPGSTVPSFSFVSRTSRFAAAPRWCNGSSLACSIPTEPCNGRTHGFASARSRCTRDAAASSVARRSTAFGGAR